MPVHINLFVVPMFPQVCDGSTLTWEDKKKNVYVSRHLSVFLHHQIVIAHCQSAIFFCSFLVKVLSSARENDVFFCSFLVKVLSSAREKNRIFLLFFPEGLLVSARENDVFFCPFSWWCYRLREKTPYFSAPFSWWCVIVCERKRRIFLFLFRDAVL